MTTKEEILSVLQHNKERLLKELKESKESMRLIRKSTHTSLNEEEKEIVKNQLLDICKAIPAFTIFMLPGGAILLPIVIKLIPDILPSAFREDIDYEDHKSEKSE